MQRLFAADLTLEPLLARHAEAMYDILKDPELYRFLDYEPPPSVDHLVGVYEKLEARRSPDGSQDWLNWVARLGDDGLIGYVQATIEPSRDAWIGVVFSGRHRGRGYATQAVNAMLEHLASAYEVTRFLATIELENRQSLRLFERLGFHDAEPEELEGRDLSPGECLVIR